MKVIAYCAREYTASARQAAGVEPFTSPPFTADDPTLPRFLSGAGFLYLCLHGLLNNPRWYGDNGLPALTAEQVRATDLTGAVVVAANCYLVDGAAPMLDALLDAGAAHVIGGRGPNYAGYDVLLGAPLLAQWLRRLLAWHVPVRPALALARQRVALSLPRNVGAALDTLDFRDYVRA